MTAHDRLIECYAAAHDWTQHAQRSGWLAADWSQRLAALEQRRPADLFAQRGERPLVVALFGGTGVGKSSLLNRLAGQPIARTGVERPTSHEVTCYLHREIELADLPAAFPADRVRIERHDRAAWRDVLWIDMPDIDSTVRENRELALAWLPHVDLLVYVVSPERYRDDTGWKLLRQRGHRHGWLFVMNRWDEGATPQLDDLRGLLEAAGFADPWVFCTCCKPRGGDDGSQRASVASPALPSADEFERIEATIRDLLDAHGLRELELAGERARLCDLRALLADARRAIGDTEAWLLVEDTWQRTWQRTRARILEGTQFPIQVISAQFAAQDGGWWPAVQRGLRAAGKPGAIAGAVLATAKPKSADANQPDATADAPDAADQLPQAPDRLADAVWEAWSDEKLADMRDAIEVELHRAGMAAEPIVAQIDRAITTAGRVVRQSAADHLRLSLATAGSYWRRALGRVLAWLCVGMPVAALLWVAWNVVVGYYRATVGSADFLGIRFAVNSVLLVVIAWAVPYALQRLLRPSLERIARRGLEAGLEAGLDELGERLEQARAEIARQRQELLDEHNRLLADVSRLVDAGASRPSGAAARLVATSERSASR